MKGIFSPFHKRKGESTEDGETEARTSSNLSDQEKDPKGRRRRPTRGKGQKGKSFHLAVSKSVKGKK